METKYSDKLLGFLWDKTSTFFCNFFVLLLRKKIDKQNKKDWKEHGDFPNTFRFIVDFTRLQDGGEFDGGEVPEKFIVQNCNLRRRKITTDKVLLEIWVLKQKEAF